MSFVYAGIKVRKNLPAAIRDLFVVDEHNKTDPATGRVNVYRRITYYDSDLGYNVYGSSSKPPSLIDGEANLFKLGALDWGLKSVESSRER